MADSAVVSELSPAGNRRAVAVALLVASAFFMEMLDGTVIATALPQMAITFGVGPVDLNIGMTAYLLMLAVFIPVSGWVADRFGPRTVFASAITVFTLASILCGMSNGLWSFTAARILQGIGGAMMVPVGRLVVLRVTEKKDLMRAIAYITWPALAAPVIAPPLGGFITTYSSWRWIFFLNVPLGLIGLVLSLRWIANEREENTRRFDWIGFFWAATCCVAFMYSLEILGQQITRWPLGATLLAYSLVAGWMGVRHMSRTKDPLIDFSCLKVKTFSITIWGGSLFRIAISVSPFLLPLMFQIPFGMSAFQSGLLVISLFAGNLAMKTVTTPVLRNFGFRSTLLVNGIITGLLILSFITFSPATPKWLITVILFFHGLTRSMQFTGFNTIAFVDIPKPQMSSATSFATIVQQMTMGMGVAVGALLLRIAGFIRDGGSSMPTLRDFHVAFFIVSIIAFLGVLDSFTLERHAGAEVSGHKVARA